MPIYRIDLAYDGTGFHGYARQEGVRTVQGELEAALEKALRHPVETVCAGRTDAGVHAKGQVASVEATYEIDVERVGRALNSILPSEIVVHGVRRVEDGFSARFSAVWREYRYQVLNSSLPDPLRRNTTWHVAAPLDLEAMNRASALIVGQHDFSSFCRQAEGRSSVREVVSASWRRDDDLTVFAIRASAFCHQMVRSLVGHLVDVGRGRADPDAVAEVLARRDRSAARPMAPARGLILWEVGYRW